MRRPAHSRRLFTENDEAGAKSEVPHQLMSRLINDRALCLALPSWLHRSIGERRPRMSGVWHHFRNNRD